MANKPDPIDPSYISMNYTDLLKEIEFLKNNLKELKTKRNFVQQERDLIENYYQISIEEEKTINANVLRQAKMIEDMETNHKYEINAFSNKYQHLEFEHENFIDKTLVLNGQQAVDDEENTRKNRENIFFIDKVELKTQLKEDTENNRLEIEKEKDNLKKTYEVIRKQLDDSLKEVKRNYDEKLKNLELDLELRLKIEIHELEERKNLHISCLVKSFDDRMNNWKEESIIQIRENINLIKINNENYDKLLSENENLSKEEKELDKEIYALNEKLQKVKEKHSEILNRLAKYYNQEINKKNMTHKIELLKNRSLEIDKKSEESLKEKEVLIKEIEEIMKKYNISIENFKLRAEYKNMLLDNQLNNLHQKFMTKENELESLLSKIESSLNNENDSITKDKAKSYLEDIKNVLIEKSKVIKSLKYSISKATKVRLIFKYRHTTIP